MYLDQVGLISSKPILKMQFNIKFKIKIFYIFMNNRITSNLNFCADIIILISI